ncbi:hypothetical protein NDA11_001091 [Ustilago hordei]|nr:hypothetical protein NDA11_001091 [Ustilago hordei]
MRSIPASLRVGSGTISPTSISTTLPASTLIRILPSNTRFSSTNTRSPRPRPPLLKLCNAHLKTLPSTRTLDWTINDHAAEECWAIIAPASEQGGCVRRELVDILSARIPPRLSPCNLRHPPAHPFLLHPSQPDAPPRAASQLIKLVSFATKIRRPSCGSGESTNYLARYGAIRDQDRTTLYERLMDSLDCPLGLVARQRFLPDPFATASTEEVALFKYKSCWEREKALDKAKEADRMIRKMAPLLLITDELLDSPVIALSNGQTRRARILSSLIVGAEVVVLEEPFSGIDADTRLKLSELFRQLHAARSPRLVLVLREQDAIPDLVTHVLRVNDQGEITYLGPRNNTCEPSRAEKAGAKQPGPTRIRNNAALNIGRGNTSLPAIISLSSVSIQYGQKVILDNVSLNIHPSTRLILAGDNGSGKTTLLALLLGDHAKSFSFPSASLSLFSHARDHPSNARSLLNRRTGHLSPELFNAFPRKALSTGGLTVGQVVASGFENLFSPRKYTQSQKERVDALLHLFADLIKPTRDATVSSQTEQVQECSARPFNELTHSSQALVLFLRAVVANPQLLVLDEPFQGMDKYQVERIRRFIDEPENLPIGATPELVAEDLRERRQMAIVLVSHYQSEWPLTFGSLLRLNEGRVVEQI